MFREFFCALFALAALPVPAQADAVLLVIVDDVSQEIARPEGYQSAIERLASVGRLYVNFTSSPVCSNTRAKVFGGLYTPRADNLVFGVFSKAATGALPVTPYSLGQSTPNGSAWGKWHLAENAQHAHPIAFGFSDWGGSMDGLQRGGGDYYRWRLARESGKAWEETYATTWVTDAALSAVGAGHELVLASYNAVHNPTHIPPLYLLNNPSVYDFSSAADRRAAMFEALSTELDRLLATALGAGYTVVLLSDNGGPKTVGGKNNLYETALNTDLLIVGPGVVQGTSSAVVDATDVHATVWELVTGAVPAVGDGVSFLAEARGEGPHGREFAFADLSGDVLTLPAAWGRSVRDVRYKLIVNADGSEELYDLLTDPNEATNEAGNPVFQDALERLRDALVERLTP